MAGLELGVLVCRGCGMVVGKAFAEEPRVAGWCKVRRTCRRCVAQVCYDPAIDAGVRA